MPLFYAPLLTETSFTLSQEESRHCFRVLRFSKGDNIHVTDGKGKLILAKIISCSEKEVLLQPEQVIQAQQEPQHKIHLAVSPTKNMSRFEWFTEKAVETGVTEITPLLTRRTEKAHIRTDRLRKIALEAMKQSWQPFLTIIHEPIRFDSLIKTEQHVQSNKLIAWCGDSGRIPLHEKLLLNKETLLCIGPEGDFTSEEINLALQNNFLAVELGKNRLRTETAALYAGIILNYLQNR